MTCEPRSASGDPTLDSLTLRSPDALVAAIPYLLGFRPRDSVVAVWLRGGRILLTQRIDLPGADDALSAWVEALWAHPAADEAHELIVVAVADAVHARRPVAAVLEHAERCGLSVRDALRVAGDRWWSLLCADPECCPPEGRPVDPDAASAVCAEFTLMGRAPMADRLAVTQSMAPDRERVAAVRRELRSATPSDRLAGSDLEAWREQSVASVMEALREEGPVAARRAAVTARVLVALEDIRVRDTVLWDLVHLDPAELSTVLEKLIDDLRAAPDGLVAPVATCCAVVAWLTGDGARATMAVDRAQHDDPDYSLAALVGTSLRVGLPPDSWRSAMSGLTRDACRFGSAGSTAHTG